MESGTEVYIGLDVEYAVGTSVTTRTTEMTVIGQLGPETCKTANYLPIQFQYTFVSSVVKAATGAAV